MARGAEGGGGGNVMDMLVWMAIGILVLAIIFMLIPVISAVSFFKSRNFRLTHGGNFEANMPSLSATSNWNASYPGKSKYESIIRYSLLKVRGFLEVKQYQVGYRRFPLDGLNFIGAMSS